VSTAGAPLVAPYDVLAPVYDQLIGDSGFPQIWAAFGHTCRRHRLTFASAADLGCGTGRFLARLAVECAPSPLFGIDRSAAMLALARRRLRGIGVALLQQDLVRLALPRPVDLITMNFNTINYLVDFDQVVRAARNIIHNLTFYGHLIFDTFLTASEFLTSSELPPLRQIIRLPNVRGDWNIAPLSDQRGATVRMHTCLRRGREGWACTREIHRQRWWPLDKVKGALAAAGFRVLGVYAICAPRPAEPGDRWVQIVAKRC
jgi:SAM-dependent methyltransferase